MAEISPLAMSEWGKRIAKLQELGWSLRRIAKAVGLPAHNQIYVMLIDPGYEPGYGLGMRIRRLYVRELINAQRGQHFVQQRGSNLKDGPPEVN